MADRPQIKGCFHSKRKAVEQCYHCGEDLCYECKFTQELGKRTVAQTRVDREDITDFGFFCADCFLNHNKNELHKKPSKFAPLKSPWTIVFIIMTIFLFWTFVIPVLLVLHWKEMREELQEKYEVQQHALDLLNQHQTQLNNQA